jgi:hypothetical protein
MHVIAIHSISDPERFWGGPLAKNAQGVPS